MTIQLDIFTLKTESDLTPRQWKLYEFLKEKSGIKLTQNEMLEEYENWLLSDCLSNKYSYNYFEEKRANKHFSEMTSARQMRTDLRALRNDSTIQKVIVQGKIANTKEEALVCLNKRKAKALKELSLYWKEVKKLEKDNQQRLVFGQERDHIEALLTKEN
ncbi:MAG: hypothetical protein M0R51_12455 [Clostridia bacterium]|jgi:hypothetical protein|nr:hypothetical protein [Clostridia bacterium]